MERILWAKVETAISLSSSNPRDFCSLTRREVPNRFPLLMVGSERTSAMQARATRAVVLELLASSLGCNILHRSLDKEQSGCVLLFARQLRICWAPLVLWVCLRLRPNSELLLRDHAVDTIAQEKYKTGQNVNIFSKGYCYTSHFRPVRPPVVLVLSKKHRRAPVFLLGTCRS